MHLKRSSLHIIIILLMDLNSNNFLKLEEIIVRVKERKKQTLEDEWHM